jgi:hypothetical protein
MKDWTEQKSVNLQYDTLGRWDYGSNNSSTKRLRFQVSFFFIISYRLRPLKTTHYFRFCKVIKKWKNELKEFLQRILQQIMKENNTWNIRHLVDESFGPSTKQPSVLYWRLTDFKLPIFRNGNCRHYLEMPSGTSKSYKWNVLIDPFPRNQIFVHQIILKKQFQNIYNFMIVTVL